MVFAGTVTRGVLASGVIETVIANLRDELPKPFALGFTANGTGFDVSSLDAHIDLTRGIIRLVELAYEFTNGEKE